MPEFTDPCCCASCRFSIFSRPVVELSHGECRRRAPTSKARWPKVYAGDWCGEYSEKRCAAPGDGGVETPRW
jgi:hypothetical protein